MNKGHLSKNLAKLMKKHDIKNESQLAKTVCLPQTTINKLTSGSSSDPRISTIKPIAEHFQTTIDALISASEMEPLLKQDVNEHANIIPIIQIDELLEILEDISNLTSNNWPNWKAIDKYTDQYPRLVLAIPAHVFPSPFQQHSALQIKLLSSPTHHGYALLNHKESKSINIKRLYFDDAQCWLASLEKGPALKIYDSSLWQLIGIIECITINAEDLHG